MEEVFSILVKLRLLFLGQHAQAVVCLSAEALGGGLGGQRRELEHTRGLRMKIRSFGVGVCLC